MKTKKAKKRNPTDATMRSIRALKKRVKKLEDKVISLDGLVKAMLQHIHM